MRAEVVMLVSDAEQVGNAVPPRLAAHVLAGLIG